MTTQNPAQQQAPHAVATIEVAPLESTRQGAIIVRTIEQAYSVAGFLLESGLAPKSYYEGDRNRHVTRAAGSILMGLRVGLDPIAALASIANVNGSTKLWGQGALALVQSQPEFAGLVDTMFVGEQEVQHAPAGELPNEFGVRVVASRKGRPDVVVAFTWADAKRAGLATKATYKAHGPQMLYRRAVARAIDRQWADRLNGLGVVFEDEPLVLAAEDYQVRDAEPDQSSPRPDKPTARDLGLPTFGSAPAGAA